MGKHVSRDSDQEQGTGSKFVTDNRKTGAVPTFFWISYSNGDTEFMSEKEVTAGVKRHAVERRAKKRPRGSM